MKIAFLSIYSGQVDRGAEVFVQELAQRLKRRHDVNVYKGEKSSSFVKYSSGWRFYLDRQSRQIKSFTGRVLQHLPKDTDIIIPVNGGWQSILCRLWTWRHGAKLIISGQSGPGWDDRINLLCRPDAFVALTNYQASWAGKNAFGVKVTRIPNGVDLEKFNPQTKSAKVDLPRPLFLCVAALEADKQVDLTIKAVAKLGKGSLLVLGTGRQQKELEKIGAALLPGRFRIISVPHAQIPTYYAAADVVTMVPPLSESFGIVFLEALATGKPVVTSNDSPRKEIVGNAGLFVNPQDVSQYGAALEQALTTNWGEKPRRQAENFSWEKIAKRYEELFKSLG